MFGKEKNKDINRIASLSKEFSKKNAPSQIRGLRNAFLFFLSNVSTLEGRCVPPTNISKHKSLRSQLDFLEFINACKAIYFIFMRNFITLTCYKWMPLLDIVDGYNIFLRKHRVL